ncbi:hypothetical protein ACU4GD_44110 [Cupriavidus basilensis]
MLLAYVLVNNRLHRFPGGAGRAGLALALALHNRRMTPGLRMASGADRASPWAELAPLALTLLTGFVLAEGRLWMPRACTAGRPATADATLLSASLARP